MHKYTATYGAQHDGVCVLGAKVWRRGPAAGQGLPSTGWSTFIPENLLIQGRFGGSRATSHPWRRRTVRADQTAGQLPSGLGVTRESSFEEAGTAS